MSLTLTYTELVDMMQEFPEEASDEYVDLIPKLIGAGELRLIRDLDVEFFDVTIETLLVVADDNTITKPNDFVIHRSFDIRDPLTGIWDPLEYRANDFVRSHSADPTATGKPRYIADSDEFEWIVSPYSDDDYDIRARIVQRPEGLSVSTATTWLSLNAADALLTACLMEAEHFIKADDRYEDLKTKYYQELLPTVRKELRTAIKNGDYSPVRPAADTAE